MVECQAAGGVLCGFVLGWALDAHLRMMSMFAYSLMDLPNSFDERLMLTWGLKAGCSGTFEVTWTCTWSGLYWGRHLMMRSFCSSVSHTRRVCFLYTTACARLRHLSFRSTCPRKQHAEHAARNLDSGHDGQHDTSHFIPEVTSRWNP